MDERTLSAAWAKIFKGIKRGQMKKFASVTIKAPDCQKRIDIDITELNGIEGIFLVIEDVISKNNLMQKGDKLDYISFYEVTV